MTLTCTNESPVNDNQADTETLQKRHIVRTNQFIIYITQIGNDQAHLTASVTDSIVSIDEVCKDIYKEIADYLINNSMQIVHERFFGSLSTSNTVLNARNAIMTMHGFSSEIPYTFIEGNPTWGEGFSGVQIRTVRLENSDSVELIRKDGQPIGRTWKRSDARFVILQSMNGKNGSEDKVASRNAQTAHMFENTQDILKEFGGSFKNVARTWIYLSNILDWYDDFNMVRNQVFSDFDLLRDPADDKADAERVFMPASTGILGENSVDASGAMDVFAVIPDADSDVIVEATSGVDQKSPYRYGSAFSRGMKIQEPDVRHILLSGTASIDETGKTVFLDDTEKQIIKTFEVSKALVEEAGGTMDDMIDATVFVKKASDIEIYDRVAKMMGYENLPTVKVVADVCRHDLLFELDAAFAVE